VKEHFVIEQITFEQNAKSQKGEGIQGNHRALKMHVCVGWCVNEGLWSYTMLTPYSAIEWMISMIATVRLWHHCNIVWIRPDLYTIYVLNNLAYSRQTCKSCTYLPKFWKLALFEFLGNLFLSHLPNSYLHKCHHKRK